MKLVTTCVALLVALTACTSPYDDDGSGRKDSPLGAEGASAEDAANDENSDEKKETTPPPTPSTPCPVVMAPPADFCPSGKVIEKHDEGCVTGFDCFVCPAVMAPPAGACDGQWQQEEDENGCPRFVCVE